MPLILFLLVLAGAAFPPVAAASAQDRVVVEAEGRILWAKVLGDTTLIASKRPGHRPNRIQRVVDGRAVAARGLTDSGTLVEIERPGRDRTGRVMVPFSRGRPAADGRVVDVRWYLYDARRDTATRLRGLPGGRHTPTHVAIWQHRIAYTLERGRRAGVYLRDRDGTRRISRLTVSDFDDPLVMRTGSLVMVAGAGDETWSLHRLMDGGEVCPEQIAQSEGDADHAFVVREAWLTGRQLSWFAEAGEGTAGNLVLGTQLTGDCSTPEPPGAFEPVMKQPVVLEGSTLFLLKGRTLYRRELPGGPSRQPPANDDVAQAQDISGALPREVSARIGYATRGAAEPPVTGSTADDGTGAATRTTWFSYRPAKAQSVILEVRMDELLEGGLPAGAFTVYDDPGTGTLTALPRGRENDLDVVRFTADPAHRYLIGIGSDTPLATWPAFHLRLRAG